MNVKYNVTTCGVFAALVHLSSRRTLSALLLAFIILAALSMVYLGVEVVRLPVDKDVFADKSGLRWETNFHRLGTELWKNLVATSNDDQHLLAVQRHEYYGGSSSSHVPRFASRQEVLLTSHLGHVQNVDVGHNLDLLINNTWTNFSDAALGCGIRKLAVSSADIQMLDVYKDLTFDNADGGTWKQGFPLNYNESQWDTNNKLHVFVVPHSHNDPGWLKTFEKYYLDHTQHILNNMVTKLAEDNRRKFIWAEISFLSLWWKRIGDVQRHAVRKLIANGQLEIVTGGWVMNDEAVTHFFAMTEQLIEGHEWLMNHIGYYPNNGWSIDPFGLSPTMAYLLKRMGLSHMVIQRVHYSVKKYLAKQQHLEFFWRQMWDNDNSTDIHCHVMPFYSYDIPHTCGPDPKICCQFDFKRLPGGKTSCPWKIPPQPITHNNVEERAAMLLDQYRKKSVLFRSNVVLVPLGDDFRFDKAIEWDQQFTNYQRLFDYMNSRHEWNVKAEFGTLNDYFTALEIDLLEGGSHQKTLNLPSLAGDFFSYSDRDDHYWSGYYSSRPFYKNMDRSLESYLRAGEIALSTILSHPVSADHLFLINQSLPLIVESRRNLGLFQHHDAITGTSKDAVVVDYAKRLLHSIRALQEVLGRAASLLLANHQFPHIKFDLDDSKVSHSSISRKTLVNIPPEGRTVVFYNSLGWRRSEMVTLLVSTIHLCVVDPLGTVVAAQIIPVWQGTEIVADMFVIAFIANIPALGFATYKLISDTSGSCSSFSQVTVQTTGDLPGYSGMPWSVSRGQLGDFVISNTHIATTFSDGGFLKSITTKHDNFTLDVTISFLQYGTRKQKDKSGAYLFLPGGDASPIPIQDRYFRVIEGPLLSEVNVFLPHVHHTVWMKSSPGIDGIGVEVENVIDIGKEKNREIVMRMETSIRSGADFFTDLNGFQMIHRRTLHRLPLQANFYPVSAMAHIQDELSRFTVVLGQPLGGSSLRPGWLEFILDRRLIQDDNRGLQQGVLDNLPTPSHFRLLVEQRVVLPQAPSNSILRNVFPSITAHIASLSLLYPIVRLISIPDGVTSNWQILPTFSLLNMDLPLDMHIVNLRSVIAESESSVLTAKNMSLLLLHRVGFDCQFQTSVHCNLCNGKINLGHTFAKYFKDEVVQTSLSGFYDLKTFSKSKVIELQPMELYAFKLRW